MLHNDFFKINALDFDENEINANISLKHDHVIFDGHFPGNPVTPGVIQMQIVKEILEVYFEKKLQLQSMGRCKFLNVLSPIDTKKLDVKIKIKETESVLEIIAAGINEETTFFKFNATYRYR